MNITNVAKKLQRVNGTGKYARDLYNMYYEETNKTMTVVNVITELIELITKKEFDISKSIRILTLSEDEKIFVFVNSNINMITIKNSKTKNSYIISTSGFCDVMTKKESVLINDIIYHVLDDFTHENIRLQYI